MARRHSSTRRRVKKRITRRKAQLGGQVPTFHILLTASGRPSLKEMMESIKGDLKEGDGLTIIFDGEDAFKESTFDDSWKEGFKGKVNVITEKERTANWGHKLRTKYQGILEPKTTFVMHGDDDDLYIPGFLEKLRESCTEPETLYIAKMGFKHETWPGEVIPRNENEKIEHGNIGSPNGIIPYDLVSQSEWLPNYLGDFNYYDTISKKAKNIKFLPHIIYTVMSDVKNKPKFQDYIFYHIYCNKYTMPILKDQITKIIFSGLYEHVHSIKCFLAGEKEHIDKADAFLKESGKKFVIEERGPDDKSFERFTLNKIPKYITDADHFLYLHTKGVSEKHASNENVYWWRTWMEFNLIQRYEYCLEMLKSHDIVGVGYTTKMIGPHFSGNFWWSKGSYLHTLPKNKDGTLNIGNAYLDPENFIFKGKDPKHIDIDEGRSKDPNADYYSLKPGVRAANSSYKKVEKNDEPKKGGRRKTH